MKQTIVPKMDGKLATFSFSGWVGKLIFGADALLSWSAILLL